MAENADSPTRALLRSYIDRIANNQTSIQELQREINQFKQDARADKFNMEAVHILGQVISKSPHDNGVGLLTDILRYAQLTGVELDAIVAKHDDHAQEDDFIERTDPSDVFYSTTTNLSWNKRLSLILQLTLGIVVAGGFIWLVR